MIQGSKESNDLTPLIRSTQDICVAGGKGSGKNIWLAYNAFRKYLKGCTVYSTFHLNFPYKPVRTIDDLFDCNNGVVLFDDAERIASSKFLKNLDKKDLFDVMLDYGKRNLSSWFAIKRLEELDKSLRAIADWFIKVDLRLKIKPENIRQYDYYSRYLEYLNLVCEVYDYQGLPYKIEVIDNLDIWAALFDTREEVRL